MSKDYISHWQRYYRIRFELLDDIAGYYIAKTAQVPIAKYQICDLLHELITRNVEIRIVDNLWDIADEIKETTLNWSLCRMAFAQPRKAFI